MVDRSNSNTLVNQPWVTPSTSTPIDPDPSAKLNIQLDKLRGHFNGTQASIASLLNAIESTLIESNTPLNPTAYHQALLSTLRSIRADAQLVLSSIPSSIPDRSDLKIPQSEIDSLYLLAIVIHHLPRSILRYHSHLTLELIQPRLDQLVARSIFHPTSDPSPASALHQPILRSIISILDPIYHSFSPNDLNSFKSQSIARPIFLQSILPLIVAQQPKIRKIAHTSVLQIISHPPVPLILHPYLQPTIQFALDQLQRLISSIHPTQPDRSITLIISLLHFVRSITHHLADDRLDRWISILLSLPKLNHPFLTQSVFNSLESLFQPPTQLEPQLILSTLTKILQLEPTPHPVCLSARLDALEHGWITLARVAPEICSRELPRLTRFELLFENLANPNQNVRSSTMSLLSGVCKYCLTDQEIIHLDSRLETDHQPPTQYTNPSSIDLIRRFTLGGLESPDIISAGGTIELIGTLKPLIVRLRNRPPGDRWDSLPYAARFLRPHILALDRLRSKPLGLQSAVDEALSCFSQVCGPGSLLEILPLNLNLDNQDEPHSKSNPEQEPGRAWLLTVLKVFNSSLGHFKSYFVPLSERLLEKKRDALKLSSNKNQTDTKFKERCLLQIKIYDSLIDQVWRLLPAYCDLPWDLEVAFDRSFAELLTQVIYSQPTLRPPILNAIKTLVDKTLSLAKRSTQPISNTPGNVSKDDDREKSSINEFGFDAHSNLLHLKSFASNFLAVLFNVYNSSHSDSNQKTNQASQDSNSNVINANRGYMVDCMRSLLEILSQEELSESYQKIKGVLNQSVQSGSGVTTRKMLDLLIILLPRLLSPSTETCNESKKTTADQTEGRIREIENIICQDSLISSGDPNIQKKSFKFLTTFIQSMHRHPISSTKFDPEVLIQKVINVQSSGKVCGQAKKERAILLSELVSIIPKDKLHHIPTLLTEVILGCKESNAEVRVLSYDGLIKIGHKIKDHGGKVDWKALMGEDDTAEEETMDDVEQEASVEEYFKMISAGLAGSSPHMISASIAALSRVLFEFHTDLSRATIEELVSTIEIFLNSPNREIAKTAIGFMKVTVISLPKDIVLDQLDKIVPGLLRWAKEHKNYFKSNIQNLLERLIRKFGSQSLERFIADRDDDDGGRKLVVSLIKKHRKKNSLKKRDEDDGEHQVEEEDDKEHRSHRVRLGDAYEEVLYGSGSSSEGEDDTERGKTNQPNGGRQAGKHGKKGLRAERQSTDKNYLVEEDSDEVMDLLEGARMTNRAVSAELKRVEKRKEELKKIGSQFKRDSKTGKMLIDEDSDEESDEEQRRTRDINRTTNAYLEAINGEDGFKRDAKGNIKFNKKKRKSTDLVDDDDQDSIQEAVQGFHLDDGLDQAERNKKKKVKRVKEKLGAEFKAKKAGGDRVITKDKHGKPIQGGLSPFAYLPLNDLNSKKNRNRVFKNLNITGKVRGSRS